MRIFPKTAGRTLVLLCLVCVTNIAAFPKDQAKLLKYFAAQSIPVDEIKVKENAVVARINYGVDDEIDEAKTEKDILAVAKKLAEAFSRSETIRLQYFIGGEELYALEFANEDVKKAVEGQKSDEEILGTMAIIMPEGEREGGDEEEGKIESEGEVEKEEEEEGEGDQGRQESADGKVPFLGVSLTRPQEKEIRIIDIIQDSPADHAGLQIGDKILQMENYASKDLGNDARNLLAHLRDMPSDRPIRFHIQRVNKSFDVWVKLEMMDKGQLDKVLEAQANKMNSDLVKGRQLLRQNKFAEAAESFQKSLEIYPMESYQGLGICYYHMEKFKIARKNIEKAYKLDRTVPLNVFYTAACRDVLGKLNTAKYHYKEYLALNHDNAEMNEFARKRIEALKTKNKKISQSFVKMIDAIIKEIKN